MKCSAVCSRGSFAFLQDVPYLGFWRRFNILRHASQLFNISYHFTGCFAGCPLNRLVLDIREGAKNHSVGSRSFLLDTLGTTGAPFLSLNCFSVAEVLEEENAFALSLSLSLAFTFAPFLHVWNYMSLT